MQAASVSKIGVLISSLAVLALSPQAGQAQEGKLITQWDLQTSTGAAKILDDSIGRFEKAHPGYKVEHSHIMNDAYKTKLKIAFGANQPPCVFASWAADPCANTSRPARSPTSRAIWPRRLTIAIASHRPASSR